MSPKLSFCITTLNRAHVIGATIESIIAQLTHECEIVIVDAASSDDTERVIAEYARRCDQLRYFRQEKNNGLDRDFDRAVELASGEYCWLLSDDDVLKAGAIDTVLDVLGRDLSLVVVNAEHRDFQMVNVLHHRLVDIDSDQTYGSEDLSRLFADCQAALAVISCIVVKRALWIARAKELYYGSMFIHIGVIFQDHLPAATLMIAKPLVSLRRGNSHSPELSSTNAWEVWTVKWPVVINSLAISSAVKAASSNLVPRTLKGLLALRASGLYSLADYRRFIRPELRSIRKKLVPVIVGLIPGAPLNALLLLYCSIVSRDRHASFLQTLRESQYHFRNIFRRSHDLPASSVRERAQ